MLVVKKELVAEIADRMNIDKETAGLFFQTFQDVVYDTLNSGEDILIVNMMRMEIVLRDGRSYYDLSAKANAWAPPRYNLVIRPIGKLKDSIKSQKVSTYEAKKLRKHSRSED